MQDRRVHIRGLLIGLLLLPGTAGAQAPRTATQAAPETAALARGWEMLSQGNAVSAAQLARELTAKNPTSAAALALLIDAEIGRAGAEAALGAYEAWLGRRSIEDAYMLRRIAVASLRETVQHTTDEGIRLEAVQALTADGDTTLPRLLASSDAASVTRAAAGEGQEMKVLTAQVEHPGPMRIRGITALAKTRNATAAPHVIPALKDPDPMVRAAAAEALGALAAETAVLELRPLLSDPVFSVRFATARALSALQDNSGEAWLRSLQSSEYATIRVAAADALKHDPQADWLANVRQLTSDPDPSVRRQAAELIAPHDPALARATLDPLLTDANPAERQAAQHAYVQAAGSDFATLRKLLRSDDPRTRVRAAARMLELTR